MSTYEHKNKIENNFLLKTSSQMISLKNEISIINNLMMSSPCNVNDVSFFTRKTVEVVRILLR